MSKITRFTKLFKHLFFFLLYLSDGLNNEVSYLLCVVVYSHDQTKGGQEALFKSDSIDFTLLQFIYNKILIYDDACFMGQ